MLGTVPAANGNPTFVGTIYIININNHITAERAAGTGGKPGNVKCGVLAAGIDLEVLDLYVKQCIDPGAHTGKQSLNGRDYFWVETSRMLTLEERQDMINDSRSWKREQEQGRGYPSAYQDSETARSRRRAGGAGRR